MATLVCGLIFLLASLHSGQAQFTMEGLGTSNNVYNLYASNANDSVVYGTDPDPSGAYGGDPAGWGWLAVPGWSLIKGGVNIASPSPMDPQCSATFDFDNSPIGNGSMILCLTNTSSAPEEMRLDWLTSYSNNSGSPQTISGFKITCSGTIGAAGDYWELAGGMTIYYSGGTSTAGVASLAGSVPNFGLNLYGPAGLGPWVGQMPGPGNFTYNFPNMPFSPPLVIPNGSAFQALGYLDLIVDPGTVEVQIQAILPPALGIGTYSNLPVVFFPTATGTNYVVQMSTNLVTGNWVPVSNGIPFSGLQITNPPSPAFFRLQ